MITATMKAPTNNKILMDWVLEMAALCQPESIYWCDGSEQEKATLTKQAIAQGEVEALDPIQWPGCLYARSSENDVARVENLTFICSKTKQDAGPTNNWMEPSVAYEKLRGIFRGSMTGRTMYVMPFLMGVPGSKFNKIGVQLTDSIYVVLNMRIMTRMGDVALKELGNSPDFTRGLHSKADLNPERRYICHFPEDNTIWSVGSNYGGNVLLGKKCLALRIASALGRKEGWLAEHMLILGIEDPHGKVRYVAAAFPSQCGKTNLAMMTPPASMAGYKVWTVGDDIAWLRIGEDGRLWAINPEAGFFGVAPGTGPDTNPTALATCRSNSIFTNVVKTKDNGVWWEGLSDAKDIEGLDWKGNPWNSSMGTKGAHPNSRFTAPTSQCPSLSSEAFNAKGVPLSAIIFGGRRAHVAPLVYESFGWQHGVYVGATMASETTAAAVGQVGVIRRDPMAMLPFIGYNVGDYFGHWLSLGHKLKLPPKIFHVNWFRKSQEGKYLWPGFSENLRVIKWIIERSENQVKAVRTPIGYVPEAADIFLDGTGINKERLQSELLSIHKNEWVAELDSQNEFFEKIGTSLPDKIRFEQSALRQRLETT